MVTDRALACLRHPWRASPSTITSSPTFIVFRVHPLRSKPFGGPISRAQFVMSPLSSGHVQVEVNVRIHPLHLGDDSLQHHRPFCCRTRRRRSDGPVAALPSEMHQKPRPTEQMRSISSKLSFDSHYMSLVAPGPTMWGSSLELSWQKYSGSPGPPPNVASTRSTRAAYRFLDRSPALRIAAC